MSTAAVNAFLDMDEKSQRNFLGTLGPDEKSQLLQRINLQQGTNLTGIAPPPGVQPQTMTTPSTMLDTVKMATKLAPTAITSPGMAEAGQKIIDVGKGAADLGASLTNPMAPPPDPRNLAKAVTTPLHELTGTPDENQSVTEMGQTFPERAVGAVSSAFGGDPVSARQNFAKGDYQRGLADLLTVPLATYGLGRLATSGKVAADTTRREAEALGSVIAPGVKNAETQTVAQTVQPLFKQYFAEQGLKDSDLDKMFPTREHAPQSDVVGNVRRGAQESIKAADGVVDIADRPLQKLVTTFGDQPAAPVKASILSSLDQEIASQIDDQIKSGLQKLRSKVADAETLSDLNDLKVHSNKEIQNLFTGAPGKDIAASAQAAYAWRILGDSVRDGLYPELQRLSGTDIRPYTIRERAAIQARDGIYGKYFNEVAPQQASFAAKTYLERLFQGSLYEKQFLARGLNLKPMPAGEYNTMFRRGVGTIGEGFEPETVAANARAQKLLPPPPGGESKPFMFTIQTGLPEEVVSPGNISTGKVYQGTQRVPVNEGGAVHGPGGASLEELARGEKFYRVKKNGQLTYQGVSPDATLGDGEALVAVKPDGTMRIQDQRLGLSDSQALDKVRPRIEAALPRRGPSYYAQRQQLGTTAETIPDTTRGARTPAQQRADQLGSAQAAVPESSLSGPQTRTESKWQLIQEGEGPTVSTQGGGMLQTPNPAVARDTLNNLVRYRQRIANVAAPPHLAQIDAQIQSLRQQLDHFHAYDKAIPPTNVTVKPAKLGTTAKYGSFKRNVAAPIAGGAAANILAPPPSE